VGRFEAADGGTLFLDEGGEIPLPLQSKLLRVLQEGQYERLGEERTRTVNVRVLAATNRDLKADVAGGRFREDLYYRLNVFPIEVPPLRQRKEDLPLLADHFLETAARRLRCRRPHLTRANLAQLEAYDWPGNVRELHNVIERALITSQTQGERLHFDLPVGGSGPGPAASAAEAKRGMAEGEVVPQAEMDRRDRENVLAALTRASWKISGAGGAAELLGVKPTTLRSRLKKMGLEKR
jgi:transcriptional regulator with GAF, ATPase, and Fis domain